MSESGITLRDLLGMNGRELHRVMMEGHALDRDAVAGGRYKGIDLSLPPWVNAILWKTFLKEFVRDEASGDVRGWNVRLEQTGVEGPIVPMRRRDGGRITFGHYRVRDATQKRFPWGWKGADCLDYGDAGNTFADVARFTCSPLVAVNAGRHDLLLGWEVIHLAGALIPLRDYWALVRCGEVDEVVAVPRP